MQVVARLRVASIGSTHDEEMLRVERQAGGGEDARDRNRRSELVTPVIDSVGLGDAGPCSHGCIVVGQGVTALVAIGDGTDGEPAQGSRSSSREGEVQHGGGGRTWRCAVAIVMVIVIFGSGGARSDIRTGAALGDVGMRLGRGVGFRGGWTLDRNDPATVGRTATGKTCGAWRSGSAQRADRHDRHECRAG